MKNSNSQSIINSSSSDFVELPPLLQPQGELIDKMRRFLDQQKSEEPELMLWKYSNLCGSNLNQDQQNIIKNFLRISEEETSRPISWEKVDEQLVQVIKEYDHQSHQAEKEKIYKSHIFKSASIWRALTPEELNTIKDFLGISQNKELPDKAWDLVDKSISEKELAYQALVDEAIKVHENDSQKPTKLDRYFL